MTSPDPRDVAKRDAVAVSEPLHPATVLPCLRPQVAVKTTARPASAARW